MEYEKLRVWSPENLVLNQALVFPMCRSLPISKGLLILQNVWLNQGCSEFENSSRAKITNVTKAVEKTNRYE